MDARVQRTASKARLVVHVDLDCFYVQVEQARRPELRGHPCAVMQYNPFGDVQDLRPEDDRLMNRANGSLIAVGYEARAYGVKRNMRASEARKLCPHLQTVQVPVRHQKADLSPYREASSKIMEVFSRNAVCERASIDEAYLDVTEAACKRMDRWEEEKAASSGLMSTNVVGLVEGNEEERKLAAKRWWDRVDEIWNEEEIMLACGAMVVEELRKSVYEELGFTCSAGISNNKLLSKLVSGMYKPNQQTLVLDQGVHLLLKDLPINKLRGLGMKLGSSVKEQFQIETVGELARIPMSSLTNAFGQSTAEYLLRMSKGIDDDPVKPRQAVKQIVTGKNFRGMHSLGDIVSVSKWMVQLSSELVDRMEEDRAEHDRMATSLTVGIGHIFFENGATAQSTQQWSLGLKRYITRACQLRYGGATVIAKDATNVVKKWADQNKSKTFRVTSLYLMAGGFKDLKGATTISDFFGTPSRVSPRYHSTQEQQHLGGTGIRLDAHQDAYINLQEDANPKCMTGNSLNPAKHLVVTMNSASSMQLPSERGNQGGAYKFYNTEEIDRSILDELPEEVKTEVLQILKRKELLNENSSRPALRSVKQKKGTTKPIGACIESYFKNK